MSAAARAAAIAAEEPPAALGGGAATARSRRSAKSRGLGAGLRASLISWFVEIHHRAQSTQGHTETSWLFNTKARSITKYPKQSLWVREPSLTPSQAATRGSPDFPARPTYAPHPRCARRSPSTSPPASRISRTPAAMSHAESRCSQKPSKRPAATSPGRGRRNRAGGCRWWPPRRARTGACIPRSRVVAKWKAGTDQRELGIARCRDGEPALPCHAPPPRTALYISFRGT